jgi:hypothetical protein
MAKTTASSLVLLVLIVVPLLFLNGYCVEGAEKGNIEAEKDDADVYKSSETIILRKFITLRCLKLLKLCRVFDRKFCEEFKEKCLKDRDDIHQSTVTKVENLP